MTKRGRAKFQLYVESEVARSPLSFWKLVEALRTCSWKLDPYFRDAFPGPHLVPVQGCVRMLVGMQKVWNACRLHKGFSGRYIFRPPGESLLFLLK
jgi:hypothetical protein